MSSNRLKSPSSRMRPLTPRELIEDLGDEHCRVRRAARQRLITLGVVVVPQLLEALDSTDRAVRWEAARALAQLADPRSAKALVSALEDPDSGIRWVVAQGLAMMGREGLKALLGALEHRHESKQLLEGAHRVIQLLPEGPLRDLMAPLRKSLEGPAPRAGAPVAAFEAREALRQLGK